MRRLVAAEIKKLTTTRWVYLMLAGVVAMAVVSVADPARDAATFRQPFDEQTFVFFTALLTRVLIFVMGVRVIADELRHGTIVPTFLVTPRRGRVLGAKAVTVALVGAAFALAGWGAMTGAASVLAASEGSSLRLGAEAWRSLVGTVVAGAAWGVLGLATGTVVRSQVAATVGGLVWLMMLEDAVRGWLGDDLGGYLPGQAGLALSLGSETRVLAFGTAVIAGYLVLAMVVSVLGLRRDVT